jgi:hypothetical protein
MLLRFLSVLVASLALGVASPLLSVAAADSSPVPSASPVLRVFVLPTPAVQAQFDALLLQTRQSLAVHGSSLLPSSPYFSEFGTHNVTADAASSSLGAEASAGVTVDVGASNNICFQHPLFCEACARSNDDNLMALSPAAMLSTRNIAVGGGAGGDAIVDDVHVWPLLQCASLFGSEACMAAGGATADGSVQIQIVTAAQAEAARLAPSLHKEWLHNIANTNDSWTPLYVRLPRLCSCKQDCPVPASSAAPEFELSYVRITSATCGALSLSLRFSAPAGRLFGLPDASLPANKLSLENVLARPYAQALRAAAGITTEALASSWAHWTAADTLVLELRSPAARANTKIDFAGQGILDFLRNNTLAVSVGFLAAEGVWAENNPSVFAKVSPGGELRASPAPTPTNPCLSARTCGSAGQGTCSLLPAGEPVCVSGALTAASSCACKTPWSGPSCSVLGGGTTGNGTGNSTSVPQVKVDVRMKLLLDYASTVGNNSKAFAHSFCTELSRALNFSANRCLVLTVQPGSVVVMFRFLPSLDPLASSSLSLLSNLEQQVSDPSSPLRSAGSGSLVAAVDPLEAIVASLYIQCTPGPTQPWTTNCGPDAEQAPLDSDAVGGGGVDDDDDDDDVPPQGEEDGSGGLRPWQKGVIAACVIGGVLLVALGAFMAHRHRAEQARQSEANKTLGAAMTPPGFASPASPSQIAGVASPASPSGPVICPGEIELQATVDEDGEHTHIAVTPQ